MNKRVKKVLESLEADAIVITHKDNVFYLSGFDGEGCLFISPEKQSLITDSRYTVQAKREAPEFEIYEAKTSYIECIKDLALEGERVAFEAGTISFSDYEKLNSFGFDLIKTKGLVEKIREIKDSEEIDLICTATDILKECAEMFETIQPGITECELANLIEFNMKSYPFAKVGFDTIVAFGDNSACPHHKPTDRKLEEGMMVKIDYGVSYKHYNADVTRTVFVGDMTDKFKEIYNIVKDAKELAISEIKPGKTGKEIDKIARDYITKSGYGDCFGHGLGHGIGVTVHDGGSLSPRSETILQPGYVTSVEPGIYIEGWGGVRLEDDVLVTKQGALNLTQNIRQYDFSNRKELLLQEKKERYFFRK